MRNSIHQSRLAMTLQSKESIIDLLREIIESDQNSRRILQICQFACKVENLEQVVVVVHEIRAVLFRLEHLALHLDHLFLDHFFGVLRLDQETLNDV